MSSLTQIVMAVIRWAFYLASVGGLATATNYIVHEAATQTKTGLVSLGKLNRQLMSPCHPTHRRPQHDSYTEMEKPNGVNRKVVVKIDKMMKY